MNTQKLTRREMLRLLAAGTAGLALARCAPAPTPAPVAPSPVAPTSAPTVFAPTSTPAPTAGSGTLTVAFPFGPDGLDPYYWTNLRELDMITTVFDPLIARTPPGPFAAQLAESWKRINPTTWQIKLKQGIKFSNGSPFNAEAAKFSFDRIIDPNLKPPPTLPPKDISLKGAEVVDEYTVNMVTTKPLAETYMFKRFSEIAMLDPRYYREINREDAVRRPMGTGPFKLTEWVKDDHITFEARPDYWRSDIQWGGQPRFKTLILRIIPDVASRIAALETGKVDLIYDIPLDQLKNMKGNMRAVLGTSESRVFMGMSQKNTYLKDKRVRQALNYAVNWEPINQALYFGKAPRAPSWVAPNSPNFNTSLKPFPYDREKALSLLKAAGVPDGYSLKLSVDNAVPERPQVAQAVAADLAKVGLKVAVEVMEMSVLRKKLSSKEIEDLWIHAYAGGADDGQGALLTLQKDFSFSAYSWDNPEWEKLYGSLTQEAALDDTLRRQTVLKLQEMAVEDPPVVYLAIEPKGYAVGKRVKSWEPRFDTLFMPWEVVLT